MIKKISKRDKSEEKIQKAREKIKKSPIVKKLFKKYRMPVEELDNVEIHFEDMDVSAKTKGGKIYINNIFLNDEEEVRAYMVHELCHYLQQVTNSLDKEELKKDYLDLDN